MRHEGQLGTCGIRQALSESKLVYVALEVLLPRLNANFQVIFLWG